jgi:Icc-related predicted phosphoesterase
VPRLVCVSDTHLQHDFTIPDGDILVHAGDLTFQGTVPEVARAVNWLHGTRIGQAFKDVVVIPGNHDWLAEKDPGLIKRMMLDAGLTYLQHEPATIQGLKFFGSGYTPRFYDWALNVKRGPDIARLWAQIPEDTAVLVTHGPPHGRLDNVKESDDSGYGDYGRPPVRYINKHVGCADLRDRIVRLKSLKAHIFGHIHRPGMVKGADGVVYINASTCNEQYKAVHQPQLLDL